MIMKKCILAGPKKPHTAVRVQAVAQYLHCIMAPVLLTVDTYNGMGFFWVSLIYTSRRRHHHFYIISTSISWTYWQRTFHCYLLFNATTAKHRPNRKDWLDATITGLSFFTVLMWVNTGIRHHKNKPFSEFIRQYCVFFCALEVNTSCSD